jgi:hypothetical protein
MACVEKATTIIVASVVLPCGKLGGNDGRKLAPGGGEGGKHGEISLSIRACADLCSHKTGGRQQIETEAIVNPQLGSKGTESGWALILSIAPPARSIGDHSAVQIRYKDGCDRLLHYSVAIRALSSV